MKPSRIAAVLTLLILSLGLSCPLQAKTYMILHLTESPIKIGNKSLKVGDIFTEKDGVVWSSSTQKMTFIDVDNGRTYTAKKNGGKNKKSKGGSALKFLVTDHGSSRDDGSAKVADFTVSPNKGLFPESRAALVIGNSNYKSLGKLRNAQHDAVSVSDKLLSLGFDVMEVYEADGDEMKNALADFRRRANGYDFVMFYYAGHGIQDENKNYLVPVNVALQFQSDKEKCLSCNDVAQQFESMGSNSRLIVFDACRNAKKSWSRSVDEGLASMEAGRGSMIMFSTEKGRVALDGDGDHSPFTSALLSNISMPGKRFDEVVRGIIHDTSVATHEKQYPMVTGMLLKEFYFNNSKESKESSPSASAASTQTAVVAPAPAPPAAPVIPYKITKSPGAFSMRPISCRMSGQSCIIEFEITNNTYNTLTLGVRSSMKNFNSEIFTSSGSRYDIKSFGKYSSFSFGAIPPNVPTRKKLVIRGFNPSAREIKYMCLVLQYMEIGNAFPTLEAFELKDLPIGYDGEPIKYDKTLSPSMSLSGGNLSVRAAATISSGGIGTIKLTLTNQMSNAVKIYITGDEYGSGLGTAMVIDDNGNCIYMEYGGNEDKRGFNVVGSSSISLPPGVPVPVTFRVSNLNPKTTFIPFVGISMRDLDPNNTGGRAYLTINNLSVTR